MDRSIAKRPLYFGGGGTVKLCPRRIRSHRHTDRDRV